LKIAPGDKYIKRMGKLHKFLNWNRPILTDSGGWQVFSLIHQTGKGKITDKEAIFNMPNTNKKETLSPEDSINIQLNLGSDMIVVLDNPILGNLSYEENKKSVEITIKWAKRAKVQFLKKHHINDDKFFKKKKRPLLFAVVQGGDYPDLRLECAKELVKIGFDGYGFG